MYAYSLLRLDAICWDEKHAVSIKTVPYATIS